MNSWIKWWSIICPIGLGAFYLSVLIILPLGDRDILTLLRRLGAERTVEKDEHTE